MGWPVNAPVPPPPSVPLRQFAQAFCRGWELHRIGKRWYAVKRKDEVGPEAFERLLPFPGCEGDLPVETRRLFIEIHTDTIAGRTAIVERCTRCRGTGACSCTIDLAAGIARHPMIGAAS